MLQTKEIQAGKNTFLFTQIPTSRSLDLWFTISKSVAPAASVLFPKSTLEGEATEENAIQKAMQLLETDVDIGAAIEAILKNLTKADLKEVTNALKEVTQYVIDPSTDQVLPLSKVYEELFAGNFAGYMQWLIAGIKFCFAGFLGESLVDLKERLTGKP